MLSFGSILQALSVRYVVSKVKPVIVPIVDSLGVAAIVRPASNYNNSSWTRTIALDRVNTDTSKRNGSLQDVPPEIIVRSSRYCST